LIDYASAELSTIFINFAKNIRDFAALLNEKHVNKSVQSMKFKANWIRAIT